MKTDFNLLRRIEVRFFFKSFLNLFFLTNFLFLLKIRKINSRINFGWGKQLFKKIMPHSTGKDE